MQKYYESFDSINTLPPHAYFIPFGKKEDVFLKRNKSDRFLLLSGDGWKIKGYESIADVTEDFLDDLPEKDIPVPSCVQFYGYDRIQYVDADYPFPYDPPYVPGKNPAFCYSRTFEYKTSGMKAVLTFEGVDSCFYVYLNGKFVGFSQIAHRISEFDVTPYIREGENKLDVLVLKWCAGSYFEDQDKMRFTGIIRDVYLLSRPEGCVEDYKVTADKSGKVDFCLIKGGKADVFFGGEKKTVREGETVSFKVKNPKLWSAETPKLYDMIIESSGEYIGERIGFRTVGIKDGVFCLNDRPIKLMGVNRHDMNPKKGSAVSIEDIKKDLKTMKSLNVNAIRTSHYPSCPEFYRLCDAMGFYVISEADVECHGVTSCFGKGNNGGDYNLMADDPRYEKAIIKREECNVKVNINRASILMWSLGNEAGYGVNFDKAAVYVKSLDLRPVHYERAISIDTEKDGGKRYYDSPVDVVSTMYADCKWLNEFFEDKREKRPIMLCEYAHAMGNGPGGLKEYWDIINAHERFIGAFIWEWADHGVLRGRKLLYGGDFGETLHSGNFCMDGITDSFHRPMQKTMEMKKVYEPVLFEKKEDKLNIKSRLCFRDIKGKLVIEYKKDGKVTEETTEKITLKPQESFEVKIKKAEVVTAAIYEKGKIIAKEGYTDFKGRIIPEENPADFKITESGRHYTVSSGDIVFTVDKTDASVLSVKKSGKELLKEPMRINIWRAPTDNDMYVRKEWEWARFFEMTPETRSVKKTGTKLTFKGKFAVPRFIPIGNYTLEFDFAKSGVILGLSYEITNKDLPYLPRVGWKLALDKKFEDVLYFGYGPYESYRDRKSCCICDYYRDIVKNMEQPYVRPQENGNRTGCRLMEISDGENIISFSGEDFEFSALPHSIGEYTESKHFWELKKQKNTYVNVDYFNSGLGTGSCGPLPEEKHRTPDVCTGKIRLEIKDGSIK